MILLIDNYDSFTFNLFQLIASVTGTPPVVLRNDDRVGWEACQDRPIEAIVISPGPGNPERAANFGISADALATDLPVLGVCLGHQGLCAAEGAAIVRAPQPMHGRVSPILHTGTGLFEGLPSPFEAVRYHSLIVRDVPEILVVTATTPDPSGEGIVMAVEHREKPQWGVQFHPESISTEHGAQLMRNFVALARRRGSPAPAGPVAAARPAVRQPSRSQDQPPTGDPEVLTRRLPVAAQADLLFDMLFASGDRGFWLDSSQVLPDVSRYSILGGAGPLAEWVTAEAGSGSVQISQADGTSWVAGTDLFSYLDERMASLRNSIHLPRLPFDFALGYVGYLGYEMKADCGGQKVHETDLPDAGLLFCDRAIVLDHEAGQTWLLTLASATVRDEAIRWLDGAEEAARLSAIARPAAAPAVTDLPDAPERDRLLHHEPLEYERLVHACLEEIRAGESYEICLSNTTTVAVSVDPLETYRTLRRISPVPFGAYLSLPGAAVLSASPERFLRITADGHVQSKPIKGTRPRGDTADEDEALALDLAASEKDRSENLMIVDLLRNDLGRVADIGTVRVTKLFDVETFATVHQLVSTIEADLRPGTSAVACVRAAFPGGSMTGAPKRRTMEIIDRLEAGSRGVYSGALGYFSLSGAADLSIVIRTLVVHPDRVTIGSGGAVVALSDPQAEVEEMLMKSRAPLRAVQHHATAAAELVG
jgi:para-aminobenzoate synthetase